MVPDVLKEQVTFISKVLRTMNLEPLKAKHSLEYHKWLTQQCSDTCQKTWIDYHCEKLKTHTMYTTSYSYSLFLRQDPKMDIIIPGVLFTCGQTIFSYIVRYSSDKCGKYSAKMKTTVQKLWIISIWEMLAIIWFRLFFFSTYPNT